MDKNQNTEMRQFDCVCTELEAVLQLTAILCDDATRFIVEAMRRRNLRLIDVVSVSEQVNVSDCCLSPAIKDTLTLDSISLSPDGKVYLDYSGDDDNEWTYLHECPLPVIRDVLAAFKAVIGLIDNGTIEPEDGWLMTPAKKEDSGE